MKYIMFQSVPEPGDTTTQFIPIVFPNHLVHALVAQAVIVALRAHGINALPRRAGEIRIFGTEVECFGESKTLGLSSDPHDAMLIHNYDYGYGIEDL